jgi:hypothetical protein
METDNERLVVAVAVELTVPVKEDVLLRLSLDVAVGENVRV